MPSGTSRYWSWLFAAGEARDTLLGVYALAAEWRALMDPAMEISVARLKLAWWSEELGRWSGGSPLHPITRYLASMPGAAAADIAPLQLTVQAAAAQVAGAPLERAVELQSHAGALYGTPLLLAARLTGAADTAGLHSCIAALAVGEYITGALADYARDARVGRIPFPVDDLLAAGIDNDALGAVSPPPPLQTYLDSLQARAFSYFSNAAAALAPDERPRLRHLAVLGTLGARRLARRPRSGADFRMGDLYNAWSAARRAVAGR